LRNNQLANSHPAKAPIKGNYIEPHNGPDKYPRLRNDFTKIGVTPDGCWEWLGDDAEDHRVRLYELLFDPTSKGLTLEHLCQTVGCVCPFHMRPIRNRVFDWSRSYLQDDASIDKPEKILPVRDMPPPTAQVFKKTTKAKDPRNMSYHIKTKKEREAFQQKEAAPPPLPIAPVPVPDADPVVHAEVQADTIYGLCSRGHVQSPENKYVYPNGKRKECVICKRFRDANNRKKSGAV
jgi:hypothetical protein